ncbi:MAG TPA: hypothetical protein VFH97_09880 [Gemmatimonadales bacterium]|nr:hypothetical protein [Gemmatimonadales bacterium]
MPCLLILLALITPRLVIVLLWFFTTWFDQVFDTLLWPLLGVLFLPFTLLWYTAVHHWFGGVWSLWPVAGIVLALLMDLSPARGVRRREAV